MSREERIALLERETAVTAVPGLSVRAQTQTAWVEPEQSVLSKRATLFRGVAPQEAHRRNLHSSPLLWLSAHHRPVAPRGSSGQPQSRNRHMREMGLAAIVPGPHLSRGSKRAVDSKYPYLLRGVVAQYPNHVWGVDLTYVRMKGDYPGWLYLVAVLDWHSRYIVSWELSQNMGQGFVMEAARAALTRATPLIWNSDQGSHFTSPQYTGLLEAAGVQISMDGRGRFVDNIFTERLWRTIKYEGAPVKGLRASEIVSS